MSMVCGERLVLEQRAGPAVSLIVTMTTLGFGDIRAAPGSVPGYALLTLHVIFGYVLLGALVTRLSILFQES